MKYTGQNMLTWCSSALMPSSKYRSSSWLSCCWYPLKRTALQEKNKREKSKDETTKIWNPLYQILGSYPRPFSKFLCGPTPPLADFAVAQSTDPSETNGTWTCALGCVHATNFSASDHRTESTSDAATHFLQTWANSSLGVTTPFLASCISVRNWLMATVRGPGGSRWTSKGS